MNFILFIFEQRHNEKLANPSNPCLLYILTNIWLLRTPNAGPNLIFQHCYFKKTEKGRKARKFGKFFAKNVFLSLHPDAGWGCVGWIIPSQFKSINFLSHQLRPFNHLATWLLHSFDNGYKPTSSFNGSARPSIFELELPVGDSYVNHSNYRFELGKSIFFPTDVTQGKF